MGIFVKQIYRKSMFCNLSYPPPIYLIFPICMLCSENHMNVIIPKITGIGLYISTKSYIWLLIFTIPVMLANNDNPLSIDTTSRKENSNFVVFTLFGISFFFIHAVTKYNEIAIKTVDVPVLPPTKLKIGVSIKHMKQETDVIVNKFLSLQHLIIRFNQGTNNINTI